jgi:Mn2+/Fe2+ NRAMP family transporter
MNKELQQSMSQFLNLMIEALGKTTDFAAEQIPLYVQELLRYALWDTILSLILAIAILTASLIIAKKVLKYLRIADYNYDLEAAAHILLVVLGLSSIFSVFLTVASVSTILKITLAPRVYVIDYLKKEIKND